MKKIVNRLKNVFKRGPTQPHFSKSGSGFVLLFAVTLASIMLALALGVANVALRELKFGTSARDANDAFFAADTGIEYVLLGDKPPSTTYAYTLPQGQVQTWDITIANLGSLNASCATVHIEKDNSDPSKPSDIKTTIVSKGHNIGSPSCPLTTLNVVEREIKVNY